MRIINAIIKKNNKILTVKRKKEPWVGMYGLPGGHVDKNETEIECLRRELKEETGFGIDVKESDYISVGSFDYNSKKFEVVFFQARIVRGKEKIQKSEIEEIKWLNIEAFYENLERHKFPKKGISLLKKLVDNVLNDRESATGLIV